MAIPAPFVYNAWVEEVIDGDTVRFRVDRGDYDYSMWAVRLLGTNSRELAEVGGWEAQANLADLLPIGRQVVLHTVKPDKYAPRKLAAIHFLHRGEERSLADILIQQGWAVPWNGRGTKPVPPWPRVTG